MLLWKKQRNFFPCVCLFNENMKLIIEICIKVNAFSGKSEGES